MHVSTEGHSQRFVYNYFRTYDPSTGRYLESDPIGLSGGLNTFGYVAGDPITRTDRLGLDAWPISNEWGQDEIKAYSDYMREFVQNYNKKIDCADLGLLGLIRFASQNNLPVQLKYWANGRWNRYDAASDEFSSTSQYETTVMRDLGALNVIDNSSPIGLGDLRSGDLLMTRYDSSLGHTRIVTEASCTDSCADADITWYQGTLPPVVPQRMGGPFSGIYPGTLSMDQVPRRWNFKDWN